MTRWAPERLEDRFWSKVDVAPTTDGCWLWTASRMTPGYGQFAMKDGDKRWRMKPAHRVAFELVRGPIPKGLHIDHLCRVRLCVNPYHLDPCTLVENVMRGDSAAARAKRTDLCHRGHSLLDAYPRSDGKGRNCRPCAKENAQRYRDERAA